ncbi:hypothetical protein [Priestia megaterium]|uniref:hypothetical protein n=1 Tax=Priestia megaterium TaxID=1404 RepID=UPI000BFB5720|nr:hypothetical protein [Priestia megaterium]PGY50488.1 hypothetical protein COE35_18530 [Priestia megaterium]
MGTSLLVCIFILFLLAIGLRPKKVDKGTFLTLPIIGGVELLLNFNASELSASIVIIDTVVVVVFGYLAGSFLGRFKKVDEKEDSYYIRSTIMFISMWIAFFISRYFVLMLISNVTDMKVPAAAKGWLTWCYLFVFFLLRNITIARRYPQVKELVFQKKSNV